MYYVNPSAYTGVTVVPSSIITNCLKTASAVQLKVILAVCTLAAEGFDAEKVAGITGIKKEEVEDCLIYWQEEGLITEAENLTLGKEDTAAPVTEQATDGTAPSPSEKITQAKKEILDTRPEKLTRQQIAARLTESSELRDLMDELQKRLGRLIGQNDQSAFILLHDYYGLMPEIIAMICEYARIHGKSNNVSYIYKIGVDWSCREIDTVTAANAELTRLEAAGELWEHFLKITKHIFPQKPTDKQRDTVDKWINAWHLTDEIIALAVEEMNNSGVKPNIAYLDKILTGWYGAGAVTPEKVEKYKKDFEDRKLSQAGTRPRPAAKAAGNGNESASYDIDKAVQQASTSVPVLKKREKR